jgi:hypothetical protein
MKTHPTIVPSLPGVGLTLLISAVFAVPLVLWGNRWPWLVALPIAIIVILTVRAEWHRMCVLKDTPVKIETEETFEITSVLLEQVLDSPCHETEWIEIGVCDSRGIPNVIEFNDYKTFRSIGDGKLTAVA